jgi:signal peptidase I
MTGEEETAISPEAGNASAGGTEPARAESGGAGSSGAGAAGNGSSASGSGGEPSAVASAGPPAGRAKSRSFWRELPVLVVLALVIALVIKTFVVQAFFIPSGSMQNTLEIGDKVLVNKLVYRFRSIQPGDIIVFDGSGSWTTAPPAPTSSDVVVRLYDDTLLKLFRSIGGLFGTAPGQTDFIKRVIGVPGDHVACCNAQGLVTINGVPLHEKSFLYPGNTAGEAPLGESGHFNLTVPKGRLWVLGDHRAISDDSRGHVDDPGNGTIPENMVIGRAFLIVWPPSRWRVLPIPPTFLQPGIAAKATAAGARDPAAGPAATRSANTAAAAELPAEVRVGAEPPYLPLGGGVAAALPLTWLTRRLRLRPRRSRRAR